MEEIVGIGIVGLGTVAQTAHLPVFSKTVGCEIVAICDIDEGKAFSLQRKYRVPKVYTEYEELLKDKRVDAVVIATPNYLHTPMAIAAIEYGKAVLCEKPIGITAQEVKELAQIVKKRRAIFMPALNARLRPDVALIRNFIAEGELGDIFYGKTGWLQRITKKDRPLWLQDKNQAGGGAFLTLGVHLLDTLLYLLQEKEIHRVMASFHTPEEQAIENTAIATLKTKDSAFFTIEVGWTLLFERDFTYLNIFGTKGAALLQPLQIVKQLHGEVLNLTPQANIGKNAYAASYKAQARYFVEAVGKGKDLPVTIEDYIPIARVIDAVYASAESGKEVRVK